MKTLKLAALSTLASAFFFQKAAMADTVSENALQSYHNYTVMMIMIFGSIFVITVILLFLGNSKKKQG